MSAWFLDLFTAYLYGLTYVVGALAVVILIFGIDDLFIDLSYWARRIWRALVVYRRHERLNVDELQAREEQPLAIMVPAWQEADVIRAMVANATKTLDYENYHLFVGTYPNDQATQREVDAVASQYTNVHKIICARPGPTSKADCLNNILAGIRDFEARAHLEFAGFVLHDAEDVVSRYELRMFNYLLPRKDLIQLPVYPLPRPWNHLTSGHYVDEFAENHGKDAVVREALAGQVPSAGVGTAFSRRGILHLMALNDGIAFDVQSLTEDYDIGIRLREAGMVESFVRLPIADDEAERPGEDVSRGISVRGYFPDGLGASVRQKSRWILGIVFQSWRTTRVRGFWANYFLWRDRRGVISYFVAFLATLVFVQALCLILYSWLVTDAYQFLSVFGRSEWVHVLLFANLFLFLNRLVQRFYFVGSCYGIREGLLSAPRMAWSNIINFLAYLRAFRVFFATRGHSALQWDKTQHEFPQLADVRPRPLGEILVERGVLSSTDLTATLESRRFGERLGRTLLRQERITPEQLAAALAEQAGLDWEAIDLDRVHDSLLEKLPQSLALKYSVFPLRQEGRTLVLAAEAALPPVVMRGLERRLGRPLTIRIAPPGNVTVALRTWYAHQAETLNAWSLLRELREGGHVTAEQAGAIWQRYVSGQRLLGDMLTENELLEPAVLAQAVLGYDRSDLPFGRYLVEKGYLTQEALDQMLERQRAEQPTMEAVLRARGVEVAAHGEANA